MPRARLPGLWLEPRWSSIPRQNDRRRAVALRALAGPARRLGRRRFSPSSGYFPHSHELISKAYTQLARIWYRRGDVDALSTLETELSQWKDAQERDQDLVDAVRIAIKLKKGDFEAVVEGMKTLTRGRRSGHVRPGARGNEPGNLRGRDARGGSCRDRDRCGKTLQLFQMQLVRQTLQDRGAQCRPAATGAAAAENEIGRRRRAERTESKSRLRQVVCRGRGGRRGAARSALSRCFIGLAERREQVRGGPAPPDGGAGVDRHGILETSQRRDGRADHRAEARSNHHRPVARALPRRPRPQRRQPPACRDLSEGRGVLPGRSQLPEPDQGQQHQGHSGNRSSPGAGRPDQYLRRRVPVLPAACRRTVPPRNPATS